LRSGQPVEPLVLQSIHNKAEALGGQFNANFEQLEVNTLQNRSMITIGG